MTMGLDTKRHDTLFDKHAFDLPVHLIGAGGVGSHVAQQLGKLGVGTNPRNEVHFYDGDVIEGHNIPNQAYSVEHIGRKKADVLAEQFAQWSGGNAATSHPQFVDSRLPLSGVVFTCLDTMQARKDINESSIWGNPDVQLLIETRMDSGSAIVFTLDPNNKEHIEIWEEYWFPDSEADDLAGCGGHQVIIPAVTITAALAVSQFITFAKKNNTLHNHVRLSLSSWESKAALWN